MKVHCAHRASKKWISEFLSENLQAGVHRAVLTERVHLYPDFPPFLVIANGRVTLALGTRTRHGIFAGPAVADRASLTIRTKAGPCIL